jgi:TolB-like protein/tetratricopeptide (TPR) repeat protein
MPILDDINPSTKQRTLVFISYARVDRARVAPLAAVLSAQGFDVWWDAMIEGGAGFANMIEAKLEAADAVIVAWSATSVQSDWVRDEAAFARDRKRLVPVSLDGTEAPLGFRQYHVIDLRKWQGRADKSEVTRIIAGIANVSDGQTPPSLNVALSSGIDRRKALMLGGGAVALAAGGLVMFKPFGGGRLANSIAVLPFANLSGEKEQIYFSDGLSEEIRSALARNPALKVAAPTSANAFRDRQSDAKAIGSKLGVAFLLEGSVRRAGDVVRVAAELVDTKTGFSKWSQSFDRQLTDVFAVQSEIARIVAEALAVRVAVAQPGVGGTTNVAAYDAFLKGRALFNADGGEESDRAALAQFDAAIAADPKYADAYAARSRSLVAIANQYAKSNEARSLYDDAIKTAKQATALAPDLASAQLSLGQAYSTGRLDVVSATGPFSRAANLGAGDADILILYAVFCARSGKVKEAIEAAARAMDLDRLNPSAFRAGGLVQYLAHNYAEAIPLLRQALQLNPKLRNANGNIGHSLLMLNKLAEARAAYVLEPAALLRLPGLAIVDKKLGNSPAGEKAMEQLISELGDNALYQQAQILAQWGDTNRALDALRRAKVVGDAGLLQAGVDPLLTPLRKVPEFVQLIDDGFKQ